MSDEENDDKQDDFDLAALARPSGAPPTSTQDEEDDGKIDLRALASSMAPAAPGSDETDEPEAAAPAAARKADAKDDKPTEPKADKADKERTPAAAVAREGGEARPAAAQAQPESRSPTGLIVGVLAGVALAAGAFFLLRPSGDDERSEIAQAEGSPPSAGSAPTSEGEPAGAEAETGTEAETETGIEAEAVEEAETGAAEAETRAAEAETEAAGATARRARTAQRRSGGASATPSGGGASEAAAEEQSGSATEGGDEGSSDEGAGEEEASSDEGAGEEGSGEGMDSLLDKALGGEPAEGGTKTVPTEDSSGGSSGGSENLPDVPGRSAVSRALAGLIPALKRCADEQVGIAKAALVVNNDGSVASVSVEGSPFGGTPQGKCMEKVVKSQARFPRFKRSTFRITYPFAIRP